MSNEIKSVEQKHERPLRRWSRSVFLPILLIGGGILLLLSNIGVMSGLNWAAVWRLWPLFLIFIGLDVIVRQASPPMGTVLSALIALAAVGVFGYALLSGNTLFALGSGRSSGEARVEPFELAAEGVEAADITLDLSNAAAEIHALDESSNLIAGSIYTEGDLVFRTDVENGQANVVVGEENVSWFFDPTTWFQNRPEQTWQFGLNASVPTELRIDVGNGSATAALEELTLTALEVDGGNGSLTAALPDGDYDVRVDSGNGSMQISLPAGGEQNMTLDGGNGSLRLSLPANVEARIEFDEGNGSVNVDGGRFSLVSGDEERGVYETAGYSSATDRVTLDVETGNGSFSISEP
jgi:hypothetical protein